MVVHFKSIAYIDEVDKVRYTIRAVILVRCETYLTRGSVAV